MFWPLFVISRIVMVVAARADHIELNLAVPLLTVSSVLELAVRALALRFVAGLKWRAQIMAATAGNLFYAICLVADLRVQE